MNLRKNLKLCILGYFVIGMGGLRGDQINVVTTTTQLTDLVSEIGGDAVIVKGLMGPSVDPHLYKATARDVQLMQRADVIFYNGLHLEGRLTDVMEQLEHRGKKVYAASDGFSKDLLLQPLEMNGNADPHIWFDPVIWRHVSEYVESILIGMAPEHTQKFQENGKRFRASLAKVEDWAKDRISVLGPENRILVTSHDAYNYFGRAFGFRVIGIQGISTVTEAGLADMTKMVDFIKENSVCAIFVETSVSHATIERVSRDSGAVIGGSLFSDAMGQSGELVKTKTGEAYNVGTYLGMLQYNIETIVSNLIECKDE